MDRSIKRNSNRNESSADLKRIARELVTPSEHFEGKAGLARPDMIDALAMLGRLAEVAQQSVAPTATAEFTQAFGPTQKKTPTPAIPPTPTKPAVKTEYRTEHSEYQPALRDPELIQALIGLCGKVPAVALQQPRLAPEAVITSANEEKRDEEIAPCFETCETPNITATPKNTALAFRKTSRLSSAILKPTQS